MTQFWQGAALVLVTVVLALALGKQSKETALLITLVACCMVCCLAISYLKPVLDFIEKLRILGNLDSESMQIMLKAVGIGLTGQIAGAVCADSGNSTLGKALQILTAAVILWLSLPLMTRLLELVEKILGGV
jgi:stage III sporulation protein AD